jgi:hypothetical protein
MNHTPGPWQYAFEGGTVAFIVESDGTTVAKLSTTENSTAHSALPANARLIAAAPDLLAHLEFAVKLLEGISILGATAQVDAMRAVIAKARGEK